MAGITRFINQMPSDAVLTPNSLLVYNLKITQLALTRTGNSINPIDGATAITK